MDNTGLTLELPAILAPCGVYYDLIPPALEHLEQRIPEMESLLLEARPGDNRREVLFARNHLDAWKQRRAEYRRDLSAIGYLKGADS